MNAKANTPALKITTMSSLRYKPTEWLWPGRIPLGAITLIAGPEDNGKTFLWTDLVSRVTSGEPWPDESPAPQGSAFVMIAEDSFESTIYPRLKVHGANLDMVHSLSSGSDAIPLTLSDCDAIENAIGGKPDTKLLIVDPIGSFVGADIDVNRENSVRSLLAPLKGLAERCKIAVVLICHYRKTQGSQTGAANDRVMGSRAFNALARAAWHLLPCPDHGDARKLLVRGKCNLSKLKTGMAFRIQSDELTNGNIGQIDWERAPVSMQADDVLAKLNRPARRAKQDQFEDAARKFLSQPRSKEELDELKKEHGVGRRGWGEAKKRLGVKASPSVFGGSWTYQIPEATREEASHSPVSRAVP